MGGMGFLFNSGGERVLKVRVGVCPGQRISGMRQSRPLPCRSRARPPYRFAVFAAGMGYGRKNIGNPDIT